MPYQYEISMKSQEVPVKTWHLHEMNGRMPIASYPIYSMQYILGRHGLPSEYAVTEAELCPEGYQQVDTFTLETYLPTLEARQDHGVSIAIPYSARTRTRQSAFRFHDTLVSALAQHPHKYPDTVVLQPYETPELLTAPIILDVAEKFGIPRRHAYQTWITTPADLLKSLGILTPHDVYRSIIDVVKEGLKVDYVPYGRYVDIVGWTHETTLAMVAVAFPEDFTKNPPIINYTEPMTISKDPTGAIQLSFRDKTAIIGHV